jgi:hypothetical protein
MAIWLVVVLAACNASGGSAAPSGGTAPYALRATQHQSIPPESQFTWLPYALITADGVIVTQGPVPAIFPGPLLPNLQGDIVSDLCAGLRNKMGGGGLDYYDSQLLISLGDQQPAPSRVRQNDGERHADRLFFLQHLSFVLCRPEFLFCVGHILVLQEIDSAEHMAARVAGIAPDQIDEILHVVCRSGQFAVWNKGNRFPVLAEGGRGTDIKFPAAK